MSRIVVLCGSVRKNGNTDMMVRSFVKGASENNEVEVISVSDYKAGPCVGCNSCFEREDHSCFQEDDMPQIYDKLCKADTLVIASPVYFYGISAQLKAVVDRLHTPMRDSFGIKRLAIMLVGGATLPNLFDPILMQYQMVLDFFKLEDAGRVLVSGVREKGEILDTDGLVKAFELGRSMNMN